MKKHFLVFFLIGIVCIFPFNLGNSVNYLVSSSKFSKIKFSALDEAVLDGKEVGWIVSHGEDDNSTYSFTISDLESFGAHLSLINTAIDLVLLSSYDILVIEEGGTNWLSSELLALKSWVEDGGGLYILGDEPGFSQGNVSQYFNVYYNVSLALDGLLTILNPSNPLFDNVTSIDSFFSTSSLDETLSTDALQVLARSRDNQCIIAALIVKDGRILWNVNSDGIINDASIGTADNNKFANNSWIWLATPNPYNPGGNGDNTLIIIIIISSIGAAAIIGIIVYVFMHKRTKSKELIDKIVNDIQSEKNQ